MRQIGIISDTHGMLRPEVLEMLRGCECILHGGDINRQSVIDRLEEIAPLYVVRGNNDKEWAEHIPEELKETIGSLHIYMTHNKKNIPKDLTGIDIVIYGHSHKYDDREINGIRYLNPGSCGTRRFNQDITMMMLHIIEDGSYQIEKILIPHKEKTKKEDKIPADIGEMIPAIMKEIDAGKTIKQIAAKHKISEELAEQITRMYSTHPGIDVDGILKRIGL